MDALAFVTDPATAEVLAALFGATGQGRVQFGGLSAAIQVLQSAPCPQLIVVDISGLADPLGNLDRLADLCPEGTAVVVVGSSQDPRLIAELRAMGVVHYVQRPVDVEIMRAALEEAAGYADQSSYDPMSVQSYVPGAADGPAPARARGNSALLPLTAGYDGPSHGTGSSHRVAPAAGTPIGDAQPLSGAYAGQADPFSRPHPAADPFSAPAQPGVNIPPPATTQMASMSSLGFAPASDIDPLPRPVDLLAFLTEAQSASLVAAIIGPHGAAGRVQPGGINAAITFLRDNASPKLLLVDISGVPEPMSRVDALAEVCAPGTMVIAIGAANDVALYRDLKNAGIYEYLVKPLQAEVLKSLILDAVSGGTRQEPETQKPVMTVIGTRGGVGASTVAINVAGTLAKLGKKTILLDLDLQFGSVALTLDIDPGHGLREALDRPERVDSMFLNSSAVKVGENLYVLAAEEAVGEAVPVNGESLVTLLHELQRHFDAIVVDMPRHVAAGNWEAIGRSQRVLLLADMSLVGIRDTTRMLQAAKETVDPAKVKLVVTTGGGDRGAKIDRKEFEAALNRKADYALPEDPKSISAANRAGRTVVDIAGHSKFAAALMQICTEGLGEDEEEGRKKSGFSLFRRRKA
ncbi:MAG: AAA family ATPase [Rhodospirillaceae bacterium]|nr:AAA family ATPase [Rhodospirillaceae bacterium]